MKSGSRALWERSCRGWTALRCGRRCSSAASGASSAWRASSVNAEDREFDDTALKFLVWSTRYEPFVEHVCKLCADELKVKRRH